MPGAFRFDDLPPDVIQRHRVASQQQADGFISAAKTDAMVANISYGVAGAALAAAVVLFFLEGS